MECQYCENQLEYAHSSFITFRQFGIVGHREKCQKSKIDAIDECGKIKMFPIEFFQRIQKIKRIYYKNVGKTKELLRAIEDLYKNNVEKLKGLGFLYKNTIKRGELELKEEANIRMGEKIKFSLNIKPIENFCEQEFYEEKIPETFGSLGPIIHIKLHGHIDSIWSYTITPDNKTLFSGSKDTTIKIWDAAIHRATGEILSHLKNIQALKIDPNDKNLISGSWDSTIKIWNWRTKEKIGTLDGHTEQIYAFSLSTCEKYLDSGSQTEQ